MDELKRTISISELSVEKGVSFYPSLHLKIPASLLLNDNV